MKLKNRFFTALLAFAGLALSGFSARAAAVPDPVSGDLFLGFRASGGVGGSVSYLVKLGSDTTFSTTPGTSFTLSLGNLGADLVSIYGSDWSTRSDLYWGIFGERYNNGNPIVYGSRERTSLGSVSTAWPSLSLTARNSVDSAISSVLYNIGGYKSSDATANSAYATQQTNSGNSSSYNFQVATEGTTDFGSLSQWSSIEGDFGSGASGTILDLWRISASSVTQRGSFAIDNSGSVSYFVVPEPSTAGLVLGAGLLLASRRRKAVRA